MILKLLTATSLGAWIKNFFSLVLPSIVSDILFPSLYFFFFFFFYNVVIKAFITFYNISEIRRVFISSQWSNKQRKMHKILFPFIKRKRKVVFFFIIHIREYHTVITNSTQCFLLFMFSQQASIIVDRTIYQYNPNHKHNNTHTQSYLSITLPWTTLLFKIEKRTQQFVII